MIFRDVFYFVIVFSSARFSLTHRIGCPATSIIDTYDSQPLPKPEVKPGYWVRHHIISVFSQFLPSLKHQSHNNCVGLQLYKSRRPSRRARFDCGFSGSTTRFPNPFLSLPHPLTMIPLPCSRRKVVDKLNNEMKLIIIKWNLKPVSI